MTRPVPVALLMLEGTLSVGDTLQLAIEVTRRAIALGDVGIEYSLERIRIDALGGVRCSPSTTWTDPVPAVARLMIKLTTGRSDTPATSLDDLELESLVALAIVGQGPPLPEFLALLEAHAKRFPRGSLANLAGRARRMPKQVLLDLHHPRSGSETAHWVLPQSQPRESAAAPTGDWVIPAHMEEVKPGDGQVAATWSPDTMGSSVGVPEDSNSTTQLVSPMHAGEASPEPQQAPRASRPRPQPPEPSARPRKHADPVVNTPVQPDSDSPILLLTIAAAGTSIILGLVGLCGGWMIGSAM
jgi:hypothetical protein